MSRRGKNLRHERRDIWPPIEEDIFELDFIEAGYRGSDLVPATAADLVALLRPRSTWAEWDIFDEFAADLQHRHDVKRRMSELGDELRDRNMRAMALLEATVAEQRRVESTPRSPTAEGEPHRGGRPKPDARVRLRGVSEVVCTCGWRELIDDHQADALLAWHLALVHGEEATA